MSTLRNLPPITITSRDYIRLSGIASTFASRILGSGMTLADELGRASIVESSRVQPNVVTMDSRVEVVFDENTSNSRVLTLVYPGEQNISEGKISVHTPVGTALIGLVEGQSIDWETRQGKLKRLTVTKVIYQPEASEQTHLQ